VQFWWLNTSPVWSTLKKCCGGGGGGD
jgi:hypothetical protein